MLPPEAMPDETPGCVLLVEDEPIVRFPIAEALRDLGVQVVEASTADEAWDHLESGSMVDVVFTNHNLMGTLTGTQLAMMIAQKYLAVVTIVTSGGDGLHNEPIRFLKKPYYLLRTAAMLTELAGSRLRKTD